MRILYLCPDYGIPVLGRKGAAVHVRAMVAAFARAGHSVVVAAPVGNKSHWDEPAALHGKFLEFPASDSTLAVLRVIGSYLERLGAGDALVKEVRRILYDAELEVTFARRFKHSPPDFIYARASVLSTAAVTLSRQLGRPLLVELNAPLAKEQAQYRAGALGELAERAERGLLTGADAVLAVSEALRGHAIALGAAPQKVHVLPNGIDPQLFFPAAPDSGLRHRLGLGAGKLLGFVGGLRPWHGANILPELLAKLSKRHPDLELVIVGDGPLRADLQGALERLGLRERAVFTGSLPHEEVAGVIRLFDIALAPYPPLAHDFYFSPLKLFEYMACGVPVLAASVGQIEEVVRDGENGLLYPAGDFDALLAACDRLLDDSSLRGRLGRAAAETAHRTYTWDRNAARVVEIATTLGPHVSAFPASGESESAQ